MILDEARGNPLADLTEKQKEVLDLLIEHKTSKEISRILGISPHTVDQRIMLARAKLDVATRAEVAQAYRKLLSTYGRSIYEESHVPVPDDSLHSGGQENEAGRTPDKVSGEVAGGEEAGKPAFFGRRKSGILPETYHPVLPEAFDGPFGTLIRLGYIAGITVFLIVAALGGLSMYSELARIVDY